MIVGVRISRMLRYEVAAVLLMIIMLKPAMARQLDRHGYKCSSHFVVTL